MSAVAQFTDAFQSAFTSGQLIKCTLSRPVPATAMDLKNVYLRAVELKRGRQVALNFRYKTRDEVRNFPLPEAMAQLTALLGANFLNADLFTTERDATLSFGKTGEATLAFKTAAHTVLPDLHHNREKHRLLDPAAPWLHALGITSTKGEVLANAQDKWRQINKYLEIIEGLLRQQPLPAEAHIADMGSGKGYLTFALYDFLQRQPGLAPHITGIELRPALVEFCNKTAQQAGFEHLHFIARNISDYHPAQLDMLIALHACDTATDLALATGIRRAAQIIVAAPCCHKQIRKAMDTRNELAPVLRHGILEERQAEIVTDGIRALLLEAEGYKTHVFEFISTEHTAKNVMITALRAPRIATDSVRAAALEKVKALKLGFGIGEHYLEKLLAGKE